VSGGSCVSCSAEGRRVCGAKSHRRWRWRRDQLRRKNYPCPSGRSSVLQDLISLTDQATERCSLASPDAACEAGQCQAGVRERAGLLAACSTRGRRARAPSPHPETCPVRGVPRHEQREEEVDAAGQAPPALAWLRAPQSGRPGLQDGILAVLAPRALPLRLS